MRVFRSYGGFGDASNGPAMDAVLSQINTDMTRARIARATSFLLVSGSAIDESLSNYQNMINYLSGDGYQGVLAGSVQFSTGNPDFPGWIETAQSIEDGIVSTTGVISRTDLSSLAANFVHNLPPPGNVVPTSWLLLGGIALVGWALSQARGLVGATNTARGLSGLRSGRRRKMRR